MNKYEPTDVIGLDIGTMYSCVSVWKDDQLVVINDNEGNRVILSCIAFGNKRWYIGEAAKYAKVPRQNVVYNLISLIGHNFSDKEIQEKKKLWPLKVLDRGDDKPVIEFKIGGKSVKSTPEQILSIYIKALKEIAEKCLGRAVRKAIICTPSYFNDEQRYALACAANSAELFSVEFADTLTAAAGAYGFKRINYVNTNVYLLVYYIGASTFQVAVINKSEYGFVIMAETGKIAFGGKDFTNRLVSYFHQVARLKFPQNDVYSRPRALNRLRTECEEIKCRLSCDKQASLHDRKSFPGFDLLVNITRDMFEGLCDDLFRKTISITEEVLQRSRVDYDQIKDVILAGGSTRIPKIRSLVEDRFSNKKIWTDINPDEVSASGAALLGYIHELTIVKNEEWEEMDRKTEFTVGVKTEQNEMNIIIEHYMYVPASEKKIFSTSFDDQDSVHIEIYRGRSKTTDDCRLIGTLDLTGIRPAARGVAEIEVRFKVSKNRVLTVIAEDKQTHKFSKVVIKDLTGQICKSNMVSLATKPSEDELIKRIISYCLIRRFQLYTYSYYLQAMVNSESFVSRITESEHEFLQTSIDETFNWLENNQVAPGEEILKHYEKLEKECGAIINKRKGVEEEEKINSKQKESKANQEEAAIEKKLKNDDTHSASTPVKEIANTEEKSNNIITQEQNEETKHDKFSEEEVTLPNRKMTVLLY